MSETVTLSKGTAVDGKDFDVHSKDETRSVEDPVTSIDGSARACGVGDCARLLPTIGDPGETSGPRIDRIAPARPPKTVGRPRPRM